MVVGTKGLWDLIKVVTAFTVAHSLTLALAVFGLANLPEALTEPIIAASIIFVAIQNIAYPKYANGNYRLAVAFIFGLFHGLGFAGGILSLMHAMSTPFIIFAILGFSLGVETGNQLVLLPLFGGMQLLGRLQNSKTNSSLLPIFKRYCSAAIALAGVYYFFTTLSFFL